MKRLSTALVAATVAAGLTFAPAVAAETGQDTTITTPGEGENKPEGDGTQQPAPEENEPTPQPAPQKSSVYRGQIVAAVTGISAALLTIGAIVFSNPAGINKAVDMLNANFGLGLPHFHF